MNRGEAVHTVQRAIIRYGKIPLELARHDASLAAVGVAPVPQDTQTPLG